jgi:hypothetical protein
MEHLVSNFYIYFKATAKLQVKLESDAIQIVQALKNEGNN